MTRPNAAGANAATEGGAAGPARDAGARVPAAALAVVAGGVSAALHLGKLPPAVPALQATLGIDLVQAGFLLSLVQLAGMSLGLLAGLAADALGLRRSMLIGLALLTFASAGGAAMGDAANAIGWLLMLRAVEGAGFLLTVMPGPGLIRAQAPPGTEKAAMGLWGSYMPLGVSLALLLGPLLIGLVGWPGWWWALALVSALAAAWVALALPPDGAAPLAAVAAIGVGSRLRQTLHSAGPWSVALAFAAYSAQWMAVIGFLPAIYADAGVSATATALLTALAAALNMVGNVMGGRLLQRGVATERLLRWGFAAMALGGLAAFVSIGSGFVLPAALRYLAVCLFSLCGGMVPATLFMLGVRLAPGPAMVSTTIGLMQQLSALGQFVAPPAVAWVAQRAGGWHWTWVLTGACSLAGMALAVQLGRLQRKAP